MTDYSNEEIKALETVFEGCTVSLCDFHREKAWLEWVRKRTHGVSEYEEELLKRLRRVAHAETKTDYDSAINDLKKSDIWQKSPQLQNWFTNRWLKIAFRWVHAFRHHRLHMAVHTNNGIERQNECLKYSYLDGYKNSSLSEMLTVVVKQYLPDSYRRYKI